MPLPFTSEQIHLTHPKYRADIDGLRALAVLSVVSFHAFPGLLKGGFVGVDIFFVISGFLITSIILNSLQKGTFSFGEFYVRRIKRIFPALILVMSACLAFGWFALLPREYEQLGKHIAAGAGFVSNFFFWQELATGYFDSASETKPLLHLWSLGIEEQYYIIWPALLYLAWKRHVGFLILAGTITAISFTWNIQIVRADAVQAFFSPLPRFWELLAGSFLAYLTLHKISIRDKALLMLGSVLGKSDSLLKLAGAWLRHAQSVLGVLLIGLAVLLVNKDKAFPGWWVLLPIAGAYLIISAGQHAWLNRTVLSNRVLVWIGLISYPLYLWHWPLLSFARIMESKTPSISIRLVAIVLALVFAWLTYRFIEHPIRFGSKKRSWLILLPLMTIFGGVGYATYAMDGYRQRFTENELGQIDALGKGKLTAIWAPCGSAQGISEACRILYPNKPPEVALLGDSHARHFAFALQDIYAPLGMNIVAQGNRGCTPFFELGKNDVLNALCRGVMEKALNDVIASSSIHTVVMGSFAKVRIEDYGGKIYKSAMYYTLKRLVAADKQVIFIVDAPNLGFNPEECVPIRPLYFPGHQVKSPCATSRYRFEAKNAEFHQIIRDARKEFPMVKFIDAYKYFCGGDYCQAMIDGILLYRDEHHLNSEGAHYFARKASKEFLD